MVVSAESYYGYVVCSTDLNECDRNTNVCHQHASCINERGSYSCKCNHGYQGNGFQCAPVNNTSCSVIRKFVSNVSGNYKIDPDGAGGLAQFTIYCNMSDRNGVGVTVISHDSESRTHVQGCEPDGCYSRDIHYTGVSLSSLRVSPESPHTVSSLSSTSAMAQRCHGEMLGGCHVILVR